MPSAADQPARSIGLLYPFYLDVDMSMAFAAALAGGVAFESEEVARIENASKAIRSLRGSLKLFGAADLGAGGERAVTSGRTDESTLVRRQTAHSIFIDLHEELRSSGRLMEEPKVEALEVGMLVSMRLQPAIAPLRRVIDQVLRLLDVMAPVLGPRDEDESPPVSRQDRRQRERAAAKISADADSELASLKTMRRLFVALRDDLEHSGMIDVVVNSEEGTGRPSILLTLDKRFTDPTAIELLHTSNFTVVGKVTQIWPSEDDVVLLYRRSVLSLIPALSGQVAAGVLTFLFGMAKSIGVVDLEQQVREALGEGHPTSLDDGGRASDSQASDASPSVGVEPGEEASESLDDVRVGNDVDALHPVLNGPAVQILPLGLCV